MNIEDSLRNYFKCKEGVLCVYLFGSFAGGRRNRFSDVDVAVLFDTCVPKKEYTQMSLYIMDDLSSILDKNVDVVVMNEASCFLSFQIIKNGVKIHERADRIDHSFEARTIVEYFDFIPVRRRLEEALVNRIKEG